MTPIGWLALSMMAVAWLLSLYAFHLQRRATRYYKMAYHAERTGTTYRRGYDG